MNSKCLRVSPVLAVEAVEPALPFWCERLGFQVTVSVPQAETDTQLGFAILERDGLEVMLQTRASIAADVPALAREQNRAWLYVEVADVAAVAAAVEGCEIVVPRRRTFYGADEIGVRAPGGHIVLFSQHAR